MLVVSSKYIYVVHLSDMKEDTMGIIKKAALVTGGSGGIGSAICRRLARKGWLTVIGYNSDKTSAQALADELNSMKLSAAAIRCDVTDDESIKLCIKETERIFGEIGLLVNNGGKASIGLFTDMSGDDINKLMDVDLVGHMRLTNAILPQMLKRHEGNIINISSVWGECGASCEVVYSAAKAGLIGFTKALAKECAPSGVRVNCISCGLIDTKMNGELSSEDLAAIIDEIPSGRIGTPDDVANAAAFLASDESSYIQGQVIRVDGGWI